MQKIFKLHLLLTEHYAHVLISELVPLTQYYYCPRQSALNRNNTCQTLSLSRDCPSFRRTLFKYSISLIANTVLPQGHQLESL